MTQIDIENYLNYMKINTVEPDITDDEYDKLTNHFKNNDLNQFYMFILVRVLTKKKFTAPDNEIITKVTAILTDKVDKTSTNIKTDEQIIEYIIEIYNFFLLANISDLLSSRF